MSFPPALESWRTTPGLDHAFLTSRVLAEINFCLFCGAPAESWEFKCAGCRRRCLDPDCHRSAESRPERLCGDCEAGPGRLSCPPATVHGTSLRPPSGVELYCPCCLRGCRCRGPFHARSNIGEGGLADLTKKDLRRFHGTNVVGDGLSCFVYRYRPPGGRAEFGMTYSPVRRTDQRRLDRTVNLIDPGFMKRLPGLDWLSARLPCRHWAYLLECAAKRLTVTGRGWPAEAVERAHELSARILGRNGLFDFKLPGPPTFRWPRATMTDEAGPSLVYTLPVVPRDAGFAEVWSVLYGQRSVPTGQGGNAAGGWADRLRLRLQCGSAADELSVYILLRRDRNARFPVPGRADAIKYEALKGLDLVFAVPTDRLVKGFNANLVSELAVGPGVQLADFKIPQLQLKVRVGPLTIRSNDPATAVRWSEVQLPKELRERVPEYRLEHPNPACRSEWTRACSCDLPPACRKTLEEASASEHRHHGRFLTIRFQSRHGG